MFRKILQLFQKPLLEKYDFLLIKDGLMYADILEGTGKEVRFGSKATVHYKGWLLENGKLGKKFDSSYKRKQEFQFPVGSGRVIKGWDEGVKGMRENGIRMLYVPGHLGYGKTGVAGVIPSGASLIFEIKLLKVEF